MAYEADIPRVYGDCVVWALAVVTGEPYSRILRMVREGRVTVRGKSVPVWRDDAPGMILPLADEIVLRPLGWETIYLDGGYLCGRGVKTVITAERLLDPRYRYILSVIARRGHAVPLVDGVVHDWTRGRRLRVGGAYLVHRIGERPPHIRDCRA